jgi:hypothetical protein
MGLWGVKVLGGNNGIRGKGKGKRGDGVNGVLVGLFIGGV